MWYLGATPQASPSEWSKAATMWKRLWSIIQKELVHIRRDRRTLLIQVSLPVTLLFLFGYAVELQVDHLPTVVVDHDRTRASWEFLEAMRNSSFFDLTTYAESEKAAIKAIDQREARVAILIPPGFAVAIERGEGAQVLIIIDGSEAMASSSALNAAVTTAQDYSVKLLGKMLGRRAMGGVIASPIDLRTRVLYNPSMRSVNLMVPGVLGMIMQQQIVLLTAFAIVRERERGTMEQLLVTPIRPWELMLGKMIPNVGLPLLNMAMVLTLGVYWFKVPFKGDLGLFWILTFLFIFSCLGLGVLISTISTTQGQAQQLSMLVMLPGMILSGFIFPRETMPAIIRWVGGTLPLTYFLEIVRGIVTKGVGIDYLWNSVIALGVFGIVVFIVSAFAFRGRLD